MANVFFPNVKSLLENCHGRLVKRKSEAAQGLIYCYWWLNRMEEKAHHSATEHSWARCEVQFDLKWIPWHHIPGAALNRAVRQSSKFNRAWEAEQRRENNITIILKKAMACSSDWSIRLVYNTYHCSAPAIRMTEIANLDTFLRVQSIDCIN